MAIPWLKVKVLLKLLRQLLISRVWITRLLRLQTVAHALRAQSTPV